MTFRRDLLWLDALVVACGVSSACLGFFVWGMFYMQDLWDVSRFVALLVGGLCAAIAAVAAGERLRRAHKVIAASGAGAVMIGLTWLLLSAHVLVFLYCNTGAVRTASTAVVRRVLTYGMATDLPVPGP